MATRNPIAPAVQTAPLCDYCQKKPKFSNHSYCSKTCATQAATLCNHCHKKPKFQNFEYCGKNCANLANPGGQTRAAASGGNNNNASSKSYPKANNPASQKQQQQQQQPAAFDPLQIAKLVVQQMPQVQAFLSGTNPPAAHQATMQPFPNTTAPQMQAGMPNGYPPYNNPFLNANANPNQGAVPQTNVQINTASQQPAPAAGGVGLGLGLGPNGSVTLATLSSGFNGSTQPVRLSAQPQPAADDLECLIPGCGKPVHVDAKGVKMSDYCSQRHREEAVSSGLVSPCIMCLTRPQSHTDYFCGRTCREESLNKHYEVTVDGGEEEEEEQEVE